MKAPLTYSRGPDKTWIYGGGSKVRGVTGPSSSAAMTVVSGGGCV